MTINHDLFLSSEIFNSLQSDLARRSCHSQSSARLKTLFSSSSRATQRSNGRSCESCERYLCPPLLTLVL